MADTIKSVNELKLVYNFYDGDDRTETLQNPRADLKASDIKAVAKKAVDTAAIIGDKAGAPVVGIKAATVHEKTVINVDLK